jgi:two-component system phosphate regulon response regulator OmpR
MPRPGPGGLVPNRDRLEPCRNETIGTMTETAAEISSTADDAAHILVVDDDRRIRTLLQRYLRDNGYRVSMAEDAQDARAKLEGLSFDLIVLDIMMPGEDGLSLTSSLRKNSQVPILLLTARGTPEDRIAGLEAGADDYLPKPFEPRELLLRLEAIIRRARPADPQAGDVRFGACRFDLGRNELTRDNVVIRLTTAETILMDIFAHNPGTVFSRTDLCEKTNAGLERSVDVQINRLRRKIEEDPRQPVYLQTVRGVGYVLVPE